MTTQTGSISFESAGGLQSYAKQNYATLSQIKGQFATCGTGASTAAKVATIVPTNSNWTLYEGATVTVKFTSENTTTAPTLNVNSTGAKPIKDYAGNALTSAAYNWPEGAAMALTYDGSSWRIQDSNLMERVHGAETAIDQTATSITSLASMQDTYTKPDGTSGTNSMKTYVDQTAEGINTTISGMQTDISNKADGSTVTTLSNTVNNISDTVSGHTQSISSINSTITTKADKSAAIVETIQLWYSKANTTAPNKPSAQVTSTSTDGNAWRTVVPAYNSSYPNYFYCYQWKYADDNYGWSTVTRDIAMGETQERARTAITNAATAQTTANANIKSSVMLWFTKADMVAPNKPTAQVTTSDAAVGNAWNLVVPTYNSSYPYYFYCYQQQKGDGNYQWSDVVYDRATTESQDTARAASSSLANYITTNNATLQSLQNQVDGQIEAWYMSVDPTTSNEPASNWITDTLKTRHEGDLYYNITNGHSWRWLKSNDTYSWQQIPDSDAAAALAAAQNAQSTANGKRRIFTAQPTTPYDKGDLWVDGSQVKYATVARSTGSYTAADWDQTATDDTAANAAQATADKNVKESIQLWFTKANTTAPNKPTAVVSNNSPTGANSYNQWNIAVPVYNETYPYYYYCYQWKLADGTYTWSSVVYDQATTENQANSRAAKTLAESTQTDYAEFKQTMTTFQSTVGTTYATKTELNNAANAAEITKSASGERTIVTEDAADLPLLTLSPVYGESVQDGTPTPSAPVYIQAVRGRNLIQLAPGLVASHLESGNEYIAVNVGQSYMDVPSGSKVVVSFDLEMTVTTANPSLTVYNSNNKGPKEISTSTVSFTAAAGTTIKKRVVVPTQTITDRSSPTISYNVIEFYATYNTGNVFSISNLQLEYGFVAHDYLPFGTVGVYSNGKNLCRDFDDALTMTKRAVFSLGNGSISCTGNYGSGNDLGFALGNGGSTPTTNYAAYVLLDQRVAMEIDPGTYTLSGNVVANAGGNAIKLYVLFGDIGKNKADDGNTLISLGEGPSVTFTVEQACYFCFVIGSSAAGALADSSISNIQLEKNSTATVYEPYWSNNSSIDLKGHELHGLDPTYRDQLDIDASGHAVLTKRTGIFKVSDLSLGTLTQSNNATYKHITGTGKPTDIVYPSATTQKINVLTTRFVPYTQAGAWSPGLVVGYNNGAIFFTVATSVADKTEFLSSYGDTEIVYALIESAWYTVDLGYVDLPQVTDGSTVHVAAEVQPVIGGSWWTKAGYSTGRLMQDTRESQGALESPYTEVEWVESDGTQYVYLDWKPDMATWGFEADFIIRNVFTSSGIGAWRSDTNKNGYGSVFGVRNTSSINTYLLSSYTTTGCLRIGNTTNCISSGNMNTDRISRQKLKLHGTTFTTCTGSTKTVTRATETVDKYYGNMTVFALHDGLRKSGTGTVAEPGTVRIYSLKFYDGEVLAVDLVGAIRNRDGMTGLYDKVKGHFYPAPDMTYGNTVGVLGKINTLTEAVAKKNIQVRVDNRAVSRMLEATVPELDRLEDGQQITVNFTTAIGPTTPNAVVAAGITDFTGWDETATTSYYNVYLKLTLKDGSKTEWIPCFYNSGGRLTTHYGAGTPILLTYRENVFYNATTTSAGTSIMRAWYCDPNYIDGNTTYTKYSDTVIAGKNGLKRYTLCMKDDEGNWTSITTTANNAGATGKSAYTGGLQLGNILYHITNADYAAGANGGALWETYGGVDFRYSVNGVQNAAATELQLRKPVYLVGTLGQDGLFYLDTTKWWTQTEPTTEDGKIYILIGTSYNSYYLIFLAANNPAYEYRNGKFMEFSYSRITKNQTDILQTNEQITISAASTLESAKTYTNGEIATEVTNRNAAINTKAGEITSSVSETYATKSTVSGIESRVSTAESTITQHATDIEAKVSKDGVIAAINLSTEQESGSSAKISADKVNIEGAAIFSSGRLSTTSLNNTYDAKGAANTANATEETLYYASNSTTAPAIPTSAISTNNASTYGAWNLTLPTYSSSYPYLFTCLQRKSIGNTYSWTKVMQSSYAQWVNSINTTANNAAPKSDAVSRTQRIYYRQTAAGAKPGINETWLATSGTGYGNWSLTVPQLTSGSTKYPKLYTAVQTQTVAQQAAGNACSCSPVQLDDSTTVIDGGNIITGTIDANAINANTINGSSLTISSFSDADDYATKTSVYANYGYKYSKDIIIYGESNKYYPVYFNNDNTDYSQDVPHELLIKRGYSEQAPSDWYTATHKGGLTFRVKWNYGGWGGATYVVQVLDWAEQYSTMIGDVKVGNKSGMNSTIYLRGGGTTGAIYHIYSDVKLDSTRYHATFPYIGLTQGETYMWSGETQSDNYHWEVDAPLTTPNKNNIQSLMLVYEDQYIYISKASGTNSVDVNTTWVTASSDSQNTWTTKRPTYNANYPVLFVARQRKLSNSQVTCTIPVKDDTTTIIDGGHITTGTIDASQVTVNNINASNITTGTLSADRIEAGSLGVNKIDATSGTFNTANIPNLNASKITAGDIAADRIKTNVISAINSLTAGQIDAARIKASDLTIGESQVTNLTTDLTNAGKTATTYITDIDTNKGITLKPSDSSGNDYLQMNSTDIRFVRNNVDVMNLTDSSFRIGSASGYHSTVNTSGLHIWNGAESTATNEVASFGSTARVGKTNSSRFLMNADSLQAYNSSNTKYFEVSSSGLTWGNNTAATTTSVSEANNAANTIVTVYPTAIDYAAGTATLAVKCMRGTTAIAPSAYLWTKGTTSTSIGTDSTLSVTDLDAVYNCTVTITV